MEYAKIVAVTGLPGLFELVSSKSDGAIVRSLEDQSTKFVSSRIHNFSHLESIEVYTVRDNVNLVDIFTAMQSSSEKMPDEKDNSAVKKYFEKVYPDLDFDRVYSSDMKKMVKWFDVLKKNDIKIELSEEESEEEVEDTDDKKAGVPQQETGKEPAVKEPETKPAVAAQPQKVKAAKAKKEEPVPAVEDAPAETETKAAKKKITKK